MSQPYLVHVKSSHACANARRDQMHALQVVADTPQDAAGAVRRALGATAIVEVDPVPLSADRALAAGFISGKALLA